MTSAINNQVVAKLHLGSDRADITEVLNTEKQSLKCQVRNSLVPRTSC